MSANDLRGWVMSAVSGVACVLGSSIICIDVLVRVLSRRKSFQIANSSNFLSASLCLSAGVMLFTSLYSMLPTSKQYLTRAGFSPSVSAYILIGLFITGVIGIQLVSAFAHRYIPSHVVDCAHTHGESESDPERGERTHEDHVHNGHTERTPLLRPNKPSSFKSTPAVVQRSQHTEPDPRRRETMRAILTRSITSIMGGVKPTCDEDGPCFGVSQTCGSECTKVLPPSNLNETARPSLPQRESISVPLEPEISRAESDISNEHTPTATEGGYFDNISAHHHMHPHDSSASHSEHHSEHHPHSEHHHHESHGHREDIDSERPKSAAGNPHHHHVPKNAFLSIGLQTSLAIALHKLPEGFITYATNHASPTLGMTVFLALFIHNIVEGFAMALPLYLALGSRWKAMFWSSLLGGISQPAGAGLAAFWIWSTGQHGSDDATGPSWGIYGGMFAATAGVMTSVALQLFSEGLSLTHHRGMGIGFAIAGMGLMGVSFALTA
ncbi:Zinc/iron permease [Penicillium cf. griseofulvum]|uniref:Zinc/iron permease n=1 Tax=Penicillium cf. griseofulvum TaxID=2972120 RepID=A0A9W9MTS7_9EURO|nr:Zinc/iron permease [Penicillium cf. griseofulvum]KAJ5445939.1 Zinc/iron permease [Penicillium cf. griseofulvum]KAJ5447662.1 Zinc/iron permease [Penicillium cf. griseofulvum]